MRSQQLYSASAYFAFSSLGLPGLLLAIGVLVLAGRADGAEPPVFTIYLVSHGWHTGIVVPRRGLPKEFWPGETDFSEEEFLEFGWGDAGFYQAEKSPFWEALKAAILPSTAVLHVVGFTEPVAEFFPASGVVSIELKRDALYGLARFLDQSIVKRGDGAVTPMGPGLYGRSHFYEAHGKYTLFNNCNHWVARGLQSAGLPIDPGDAMTAASVFEQAQGVGTILRDAP